MQQQQQQQGQTGPTSNGIAGGQVSLGNISPPQVSPATGTTAGINRAQVNGGRFDFDDGGTYCGGWEDGKAHGHGVCTGPKGQGAYSGSWHYGFEVSGVYTWPSGSAYEGQWQNGKRHGLGMEMRGRWLYRGEWTQGYKGRYGVRQSTTSTARYEGTWASGLQDGYGSETYADSGTYQGQWLRGMRHGYGVRTSAPFGLASHYKPPKQQIRASLTSLRSADGASLTAPTPEPTDRRDRRVDDSRGGFVLKARSDDPPARRKSLNEKSLKKGLLSGLKIRKQRSTSDLETRGTGGSIRSNASSASWMSTESSQSQASASVHTDSNASFVIEDEQMDASVTETYLGEWKNDKRTGFGISERSDGLRYEGEWFNNRKYGYGVTTFRDGSKEEGKYKNNVLITSQKKKQLFLMRSAKFRERIEAAVNAAQRSSKMALQKADIAISRTATARGKAELADIAADQARQDSDLAQQTAKQFAPDFRQPGLERLKNREIPKYAPPPQDAMPSKSILSKGNNPPSTNVDQTTPVKSAGIDVNPPPTAQSISQSVNQSIRRASMKPGQNQINNSGLIGQTQITANSVLPSAFNNQPPNHLMNSLPNQYDYSGGVSGDCGTSAASVDSGGGQFGQGYDNNGNSQGGVHNFSHQYPPHYPNTQIPVQSPTRYETMIESTSNQFTSNFYGVSPMVNQYGPPQNSYNLQMYGQSAINQQQMPQQMQQQLQQQMQFQSDQTSVEEQRAPLGASIRRNSRILTQQDRPVTGIGQTLNDRLDHYKRPPSRDSSVDRYRVPTRLIGSRQPSVDKSITSQDGVDRTVRGGSLMRSATPLNGSVFGSGAVTPIYTPPTSSQFDIAFKSRGLGQEVIPSGSQPKRTESLYVTPARTLGISSGSGSGGAGGGGGMRDTSRTVPAFAATTQGRATL